MNPTRPTYRRALLVYGSSPYGSSQCDPGPQPQATESAPVGAPSMSMALRHTAHRIVVRRNKLTRIVLQVSILGQGAAMEINADLLELLD